MARGGRGTANTAGKPRSTSLKGYSAGPAQKGTAKPKVLVTGKRASTGH